MSDILTEQEDEGEFWKEERREKHSSTEWERVNIKEKRQKNETEDSRAVVLQPVIRSIISAVIGYEQEGLKV